MKQWQKAIPKVAFLLLGVFVLLMAVRSHNDTTTLLVVTSLVMFVASWANATSLLGARAAGKFIVLAVCLGWFAEQMGSSRGWFFGSYRYTDVLGWRLGGDEFLVMSSGLKNTDQAHELGDKLVKALREPFALSSQVCHIGLTVGYAIAP